MENDINREISIEHVDFNVDINTENYTIEINPQSTFEIQLNEQGPQGARGFTGNGIASYELTSSSGLIDTYTITFTDGETTTVNVANGRGISSITGPVSVGNIDTYTINYNDNTTSTFNVINGIDGTDGVNPTVTVGTTTTGNPGTNASVINTGTTQDVILDFTIPRGDKGDTGSAATIAIGTVTTGLPTDPASVINTGTSSAAVFDFVIPKGDTGETGATGNGVVNTEYISSSGLVDTYHINYTNGNYGTFTVTNGRDGTGTVEDVLVNGTSVLDGQDAKILIKTINSNSITGSGNLDVGTVTSVNNVSPVNGDVTLSIPTDTSDLTNNAGFITSSALAGYATETWVGNQGYITGITSGDVTTALGYTPYDANNPNGYTSNTGTVTSVNNISPVSGNVTITIPTDTGDLTNNAGFITSADITGKANTSLNNLTDGGKILGSKLGFPRAIYDDVTLGASTTQYQAPSNGYYHLSVVAAQGRYVLMSNINNGWTQQLRSPQSNTNIMVCVPAMKGQKVQVNYDSYVSLNHFRFYYAYGSESEYVPPA